MADAETLPLECSNAENTQSVPCPEPGQLPGPTCDADGKLPTMVNDPAEKPSITVRDEPGPVKPLCFNPKFGYGTYSSTSTGTTLSGAGVQARVGECGGNGTFDVNGEITAGKITQKVGNTTVEVEGPNARAGVSVNNQGETRVGAQANVASGSVEYDGSRVNTKVGGSAGVGAEFRTHSGPNGTGGGFDIGPASYDRKVKAQAAQ